MPDLLHESTGLRIVRNDINRFVVCTLHHTADPAKRAPEWRKEASWGMTPEQFAREVDIDYTAVMGSKVFPEFSAGKANIVVDPPYPEFHTGQRFWGGFDYGTRNPTSFHIYTLQDGCIYVVGEIYEPCKNVPELVEKMKAQPYFNQLRWIAADPSLWTPNQQQSQGNLASVQDLFWRAGLRLFVKGRNDPAAEEAWVAEMRQHWQNIEDPTFKIFSCCPNIIQEFETAIYTNQSERQLMVSAYRETIADVNNHALDDCKYFMLNQPKQQAQQSWNGVNMADRWAQVPSKREPVARPQGRPAIGGYA